MKTRFKGIFSFFFCVLLVIPLTASAAAGVQPPADALTLTNGELLSKAEAGEVLALDLEGPLALAAEDGTVYGCISSLYQTWFEVADDALWEKVGLESVQGVIDFAQLTALAEQVEAYNQQAEEPVMLFSLLPQRFPSEFAPLTAVQAQWDAMAAVTGTQSENALLTERVLTLDEVKAARYVGGIQIDGEVFALSGLEVRCLAVDAQAEDAADLQERIAQFAQDVSPVQTGVLSEEMTYDELKESWIYESAVPSEENFELWKQML